MPNLARVFMQNGAFLVAFLACQCHGRSSAIPVIRTRDRTQSRPYEYHADSQQAGDSSHIAESSFDLKQLPSRGRVGGLNELRAFASFLLALNSAFGQYSSAFARLKIRRGPVTGTDAPTREHRSAHFSRFLELANHYDAFLLDQFGVIHNGKTAYPGAPETVQALLKAGKIIIVLSNSSRRKEEAAKKLAAMGFPTIPDIVTSGEAAWNLLHYRPRAPFDSTLGSRCICFGNGEDDEEYITSTGASITDVEKADFLVARGLFCIEDGTEDKVYRAERATNIMARARERDLPMIVANPDFVRPDGNASPMPGVIAKLYEEIGGTVHYIGKPHSIVYQQAFEILQRRGVDTSKVAAVGDSLLHDVRGAQQAGIDAIFVASGIHNGALKDASSEEAVEAALHKLFKEHTEAEAGIARPPEHIVYEFSDVESRP